MMGSFTEGTLSQAVKPEISTESLSELDTNPLMTSTHVLLSHPTSGVNSHRCQTPVTCTHTLLHESDNASNFEDRPACLATAHNSSNFHNHNKSNFRTNSKFIKNFKYSEFVHSRVNAKCSRTTCVHMGHSTNKST